MVSLIIDNSISQLKDLTTVQYGQIRKILSYKLRNDQIHFSKNYFHNVKYLIDKKGYFPTGLLYLVEDWLIKNKINHTKGDCRIRPETHEDGFKRVFGEGLGLSPYKEQVEAVEVALFASRGIICFPTGTGKTMVAALLISKLKFRTLVVVPSLELKRQITDIFTKFFGEVMVGPLTADEKYLIAVENVDALDPEHVLNKTHCVIIDEFHHAAAKTYRKLNQKSWQKVYLRYGLTATPFRSNDNERLLLESVLSKVIYRLSYHDAVKKRFIMPIEAFYIEVPKSNLKGIPDRWANVYSKLVVHNEERNKIIKNLLTQFTSYNQPTICLVKEIQHGENLSGNTFFPFVHGNGDKSLIDKFNQQHIPVIIGTSGVLGEGIDTKPAEVIIIAGLGKSKSQFMQNCGRGVRKHADKDTCKVIIFKDNSHRWSISHFKEQCRFLKEEYGITPTQLILE